MKHNPIICALDTPDAEEALRLARQVRPHVGAVKLGLEFFVAQGNAGVEKVAALGAPVFLDLKFHDIPNTVARAMRSALRINPFMVTVHAGGGYDMMRAAKEAASANDEPPLVVGVTLLTSMSAQDLAQVGVKDGIDDQVKRLAELARKAGLDGVVCSAHEITALRKLCGNDFALVVPGIRPEGTPHTDQKRVMPPREALGLGASYLVIGRPITQSPSPAAAVAAVAASLNV